jgi:hypothetical protein
MAMGLAVAAPMAMRTRAWDFILNSDLAVLFRKVS